MDDVMIRVLLADDHEIVRAGLRLLVDSQPDMRVVAEASTGEEATLAIEGAPIDVAVLDLTMPGQGGLATARALRDAGHPLKIVVLTRHRDEAFVRELMAAGCAGYVLKQSASSELLQAIRSAARGEAYLDRALVEREEVARAVGSGSTRPTMTNRERDVLRLTAIGLSNKEVAAQLEISIKTVEVHKANAMRKLHLGGRADVVRYAVIQGWMKDP
jgi:two-component system response regulator NreC